MRRNINRVLTRRRATLAAAALLGACYSPQGPLPGGRGVIGVEPVAEPAPLVRIRAESEIGTVRHVRARLEVTRDAYVLAFNVGPDGVVQMIFPEDPEDSGFLRGGAKYSLQPIFTGYPTMSLTSIPYARFTRVRTSAHARPTMRGPGYIFVLASRTPFDLQALATEGYFDGVEAAFDYNALDPEDVIPTVAAAAVGDRGRMAVRADFARYGGYDETMSRYDGRGRYAYSPTARDCALFTSSINWFSLDPMYAPEYSCPRDGTARPPVPRLRPPVPRDSTPGDSTPGDSTASDSTGDGNTTPQPGTAMVRETRAFGTSERMTRPTVELTPDARERMRRRDAAVERRMRREAEAGVDRRPSQPRDEADTRRRARPEGSSARPERQPERTTAAKPERRAPERSKPEPAAKPTRETGRVDRDAP